MLRRLEESDFTVNPLKCAWAVKETEYLEFLLTTSGIKHIPNKITAITRISRPTSTTHVQSFVGLINYYKDMWPKRAHILVPLTELCSSKRKFHWIDIHENSFLMAKKLISEDVLLHFPDYGIPFEIYTDASNHQIGATIKQRNLPIAYSSKNLIQLKEDTALLNKKCWQLFKSLKNIEIFF